MARVLRRFPRGGVKGGRGEPAEFEGVVVRWGLTVDEPAVAGLLELNGMPRWISFEDRFVVAEEEGRVLGAVRYRTESKRLILGMLVVDPWAGEERLARALYRGAGGLARELGVHEVVATAPRAGYSAGVGYRHRGRGWRLDVRRLPEPERGTWPLCGTLQS